MTDAYTADEMMTVAAARQLDNGTVCFVGIGLPSTAANLARMTHAPNVVLIYESGTLGAKPDRLPLSIGDGILAETADTVVGVPEVFNYWLQPGRIDVGFLSAAQIVGLARSGEHQALLKAIADSLELERDLIKGLAATHQETELAAGIWRSG